MPLHWCPHHLMLWARDRLYVSRAQGKMGVVLEEARADVAIRVDVVAGLANWCPSDWMVQETMR